MAGVLCAWGGRGGYAMSRMAEISDQTAEPLVASQQRQDGSTSSFRAGLGRGGRGSGK